MTPRQVTLRVTAVEAASKNARLLRLDGAMAHARPGQFAMIWLPGRGEKPFSLAGADPLEFVVEPVGDFSRALCALAPGERLTVRAPLGHGFSTPTGQPVLVGGGCGAAPLRYLAAECERLGISCHSILGAATADRLILTDRWPGASTEVTTDDGSAGTRGTCVDRLRQVLAGEPRGPVYACGPERMLQAVAAAADEAGVECELSLERYMKCGVGVCGHCAMDPTGLLVCADGPVVSGATCRCLDEFGGYKRDGAGRRVPL